MVFNTLFKAIYRPQRQKKKNGRTIVNVEKNTMKPIPRSAGNTLILPVPTNCSTKSPEYVSFQKGRPSVSVIEKRRVRRNLFGAGDIDIDNSAKDDEGEKSCKLMDTLEREKRTFGKGNSNNNIKQVDKIRDGDFRNPLDLPLPKADFNGSSRSHDLGKEKERSGLTQKFSPCSSEKEKEHKVEDLNYDFRASYKESDGVFDHSVWLSEDSDILSQTS